MAGARNAEAGVSLGDPSLTLPPTESYWSMFAPRMENIRTRADFIDALLAVPEDFDRAGGGFPPPEYFPQRAVEELTRMAFAEWGPTILQYGPPGGFPPLREACVGHLRNLGVDIASPGEVIITSSSQAALDTIPKVYISRGDGIALEKPTYLGALAGFDAYQPTYVPIAMDRYGMDPDHLAKQLALRIIKFVYVNPTFKNPTGDTMPLQRRWEILEVLQEHEEKTGQLVPIVEDDPYGALRYEGKPVTTFQAIDKELYGWRRVIYVSTFSKLLAPGLRLGEVAAPPEVLIALVQAKNDLCTGNFVQAITTLFINHYMEDHIRTIIPAYNQRRLALLDATERYFPETFTVTRPEGGMFLWGEGPEGTDTLQAMEEAKREKVAIVPGAPFYPDPKDGLRTMRLNFTYLTPERLDHVAEVIGRILKKQMSGVIHSFSS